MRVTLVAGLPGSGKTTLLAEYAMAGAATVDDIASLDALPSRPVDWLAASDVNFCLPKVRAAAETHIAVRYPGATVEWVFFENDPDACLANAEVRADGRRVGPDIAVLSRLYVIPDDAERRPVPNASVRPGP